MGCANVFDLGDVINAQTANGKHADAQTRFVALASQYWLIGFSPFSLEGHI